MQEFKVILTWEAICDVTDIADYIEVQFGKERADRFQIDINSQFKMLKTTGSIFGKSNLHYQSYSIYRKLFPPSIIFYIIKESPKEIHILRVLREDRDWKSMLTKEQEYTYP